MERASGPHAIPPSSMFAALLLPLALALSHLQASNPPAHAVAAVSPAPRAVFAQDRVYSLVRLNGRSVPGDVEFASTGGSRHWVRMEEAVLRLRRDGTFVVSARFYRELLQAGRRPPGPAALRLLSDGASGRYTVRGDTIVLNVAKRKDTAAATAYGRLSGDRLRIRHTLRDGNIRHDVDVELRIDPTIW